eukprot:TRINITY_DN2412_c1_g1_i1.p1 TRINITY_DN2412_c1_g1~~TRINITY_DN2412_c1_g1_i1.p1  ORF type:complete len:450 (-),score=109.99 TRINITY_DN2412_c1_g1_i1:30-1379(-)
MGEPFGLHSLSSRGKSLLSCPHPEYITTSFTLSTTDAFHPTSNPHGFISLAIAENAHMWDLLGAKLFDVTSKIPPPADIAGYAPQPGLLVFRQALAHVFEKYIFQSESPVDPSRIVTAAGVTPLVDALAYVLSEPNAGEAVLIPTPSYAGFDFEATTRAHANLVYAEHPPPLFDWDVEVFEKARIKALEEEGKRVTVALVCSPTNPTGRTVDPLTIRQLIQWGQTHKIHMVFDEIYALSAYSEDPCEFVSAGNPMFGGHDQLSEYVHIVWGMSKDFCVNGFRVGALYTNNEALRNAIGTFGYFFVVSSYTQWVFSKILSDDVFMEEYLITMRDRLKKTLTHCKNTFESIGVPLVPSNAGMFFLADFSKFFQEGEDDERFWRWLIGKTNVNIAPGSALHISSSSSSPRGMFRVCFMCVDHDTLKVALSRIESALKERSVLLGLDAIRISK